MPILEPEVDIFIPDKENSEKFLKKELLAQDVYKRQSVISSTMFFLFFSLPINFLLLSLLQVSFGISFLLKTFRQDEKSFMLAFAYLSAFIKNLRLKNHARCV